MQLVKQNVRHFFNSTKWFSIALVLLLFAIPISNTLQAIALGATVVLILLYYFNVTTASYLIAQPWVKGLIAFYFWVVLSCLWSHASQVEELYVLDKYSKLLLLPILTLGFQDKRVRFWAIHAFLAAMLLTCILALAKAIHPVFFSNEIPGFVFRNYIMTGHMMALASYIALSLAYSRNAFGNFDEQVTLNKSKQKQKQKQALLEFRLRQSITNRGFYSLLFILFTFELLILSIGRTGYVVYFLLIGLFLLQRLPSKQLLLGWAFMVGFGLVAYQLSPNIKEGLSQTYQNLVHYQQGDKDTSVGFRLQFQQVALRLFYDKPLIGQGSGGFSSGFRQLDMVPGWGPTLQEPHNQYTLLLAEYGIVGMSLYGILLFLLAYAFWQLKETRFLAFAVFIPFLIGCLSDSLLFYSASGYFVLVFLALCLGESLQPQALRK
ncbi:MAG: O-antigen ligase family protein [Legionella sp.]|nr:O-antigen ligase family protein [Legionella sp.]